MRFEGSFLGVKPEDKLAFFRKDVCVCVPTHGQVVGGRLNGQVKSAEAVGANGNLCFQAVISSIDATDGMTLCNPRP